MLVDPVVTNSRVVSNLDCYVDVGSMTGQISMLYVEKFVRAV